MQRFEYGLPDLSKDRFNACRNIRRTIQISELLVAVKAFICMVVLVWSSFYPPTSYFIMHHIYLFIIMSGGVLYYLVHCGGATLLTNAERQELYYDILFKLPLSEPLDEEDKLELKRLKVKNYYTEKEL